MATDVRKGMPDLLLLKEAFRKRFGHSLYGPAFDPIRPELERIGEVAWHKYQDAKKAPLMR